MNDQTLSVKKEAIYMAAARLFHEKGYAATSMRELASAVGLEASSLYSHISSKTELLDHICFTAAERFIQGMKTITARKNSPLIQIQLLLELHIHIALEDPTSQTVFNDEWKHLPPERLESFINLRKAYEQDFLDILHQAQLNGEIRVMDSKLILLTLLSALRWLYVGSGIHSQMDSEQIKEHISTLLLKGMMPS